jgi:hypothetical protein
VALRPNGLVAGGSRRNAGLIIEGGEMTELHFPELGRRSAGRVPGRGVLVCWLAADGSRVHVGDRLAEVRAAGDGVDVGWVSALATGTLWHQARPGEVLRAGAVVGLID